jgi:hypothetical protein
MASRTKRRCQNEHFAFAAHVPLNRVIPAIRFAQQEMPDDLGTSMTSVSQCRHVKNDGSRCGANAQAESELCFFHDPGMADQRAAARRAGGTERSRKVLFAPNTTVKELRTIADVVDLVGETINQVRRGQLDMKIANTVGYLSGILLTALDKGQLEQRLAALEAIVEAQGSSVPAETDNYSFAFDGQAGVNGER